MTRHHTLIALATGLGVLGEARGAIVCFPDQDIALPNTYAGVSVDLETGAWSTSINGLAGGDANFFLGGPASATMPTRPPPQRAGSRLGPGPATPTPSGVSTSIPPSISV